MEAYLGTSIHHHTHEPLDRATSCLVCLLLEHGKPIGGHPNSYAPVAHQFAVTVIRWAEEEDREAWGRAHDDEAASWEAINE